jgi:hypothetical protein
MSVSINRLPTYGFSVPFQTISLANADSGSGPWRFTPPGSFPGEISANTSCAWSAGFNVDTNIMADLTSGGISAVTNQLEVLAQPQSQTVGEGDTVGFNVLAVGATPLQYQWKFNDTNIPNATNLFLDTSVASCSCLFLRPRGPSQSPPQSSLDARVDIHHGQVAVAGATGICPRRFRESKAPETGCIGTMNRDGSWRQIIVSGIAFLPDPV